MNPLYWPVFPWETIDLSGVFMFISIGIFFIVLIAFTAISGSKKIRYLSFKHYFTYVIVFSCNIMFLFIFLWYVAIPLIFLTSLFTYRSVNKELVKIQDMESKGGWCCNTIHREQQMKAFKLSTPVKEQKELKFNSKRLVRLNFAVYIIFSVGLPIVLTLFLWRIGIGYRWSSYSLI